LPILPTFVKAHLLLLITASSANHIPAATATYRKDMSSSNSGVVDAALQILFGVAAIFGVAVALFGLHYRDSLGFVLYRRFTHRSTERMLPRLASVAHVAAVINKINSIRTRGRTPRLKQHCLSASFRFDSHSYHDFTRLRSRVIGPNDFDFQQ